MARWENLEGPYENEHLNPPSFCGLTNVRDFTSIRTYVRRVRDPITWGYRYQSYCPGCVESEAFKLALLIASMDP